MRTTLDIDDDVLEAAKDIAKVKGSTAGKVISDLARQAMTTPVEAPSSGPAGAVLRDGWYVLPSRGGAPVSNELVERLLDGADLTDAGLKPNI